jgi:hypothetical protein
MRTWQMLWRISSLHEMYVDATRQSVLREIYRTFLDRHLILQSRNFFVSIGLMRNMDGRPHFK